MVLLIYVEQLSARNCALFVAASSWLRDFVNHQAQIQTQAQAQAPRIGPYLAHVRIMLDQAR